MRTPPARSFKPIPQKDVAPTLSRLNWNGKISVRLNSPRLRLECGG
jgi:hypothetical protein